MKLLLTECFLFLQECRQKARSHRNTYASCARPASEAAAHSESPAGSDSSRTGEPSKTMDAAMLIICKHSLGTNINRHARFKCIH